MTRVSLDRAQLQDLTVFPEGVPADRLIFEAAMHPPAGLGADQRRFLRASYLRALRRAQGWEIDNLNPREK